MNEFETARHEMRMSVKEASDKTGVPIRTIYHWEKGERIPAQYVKEMYIGILLAR